MPKNANQTKMQNKTKKTSWMWIALGCPGICTFQLQRAKSIFVVQNFFMFVFSFAYPRILKFACFLCSKIQNANSQISRFFHDVIFWECGFFAFFAHFDLPILAFFCVNDCLKYALICNLQDHIEHKLTQHTIQQKNAHQKTTTTTKGGTINNSSPSTPFTPGPFTNLGSFKS